MTHEELNALQMLVQSDIPRTRLELELSVIQTEKLRTNGYINHVGRQMNNKRGRPANLYWATAKARRTVAKAMQLA